MTCTVSPGLAPSGAVTDITLSPAEGWTLSEDKIPTEIACKSILNPLSLVFPFNLSLYFSIVVNSLFKVSNRLINSSTSNVYISSIFPVDTFFLSPLISPIEVVSIIPRFICFFPVTIEFSALVTSVSI